MPYMLLIQLPLGGRTPLGGTFGRSAHQEARHLEGLPTPARRALALVRHVLTTMPVHILLPMVINPTILKKITTMVRDFLWQGCQDRLLFC